MNRQQIVEKVRNNKKTFGLMAVAIVIFIIIALCQRCSGEPTVPTNPGVTSSQPCVSPPAQVAPEVEHQSYTVVKGDFLKKIADDHNVAWEAVLLLNEDDLKVKYEDTCSTKSQKYRANPKRRGLFCNDRFNRPYGNTLMPGWELKIPTTVAPTKIEATVASIAGNRVALVIDDTGSLGNDRTVVSEWYLAACRKSGKQIIGVWVYSDGEVRHYNDAAGVELRTVGGLENTYGALKIAASEKPDSIVLVTDEPGDDWGDWSGVSSLPPVVAHCLLDPMAMSCEPNLKRLANATRGQFVVGLDK